MPSLPAVGSPAPRFSLTADDGRTVTLEHFAGRPVVLFFYPKDDTPGCTREACGFRDRWAEYERRGAAVLGVSADDVTSHQAFKKKFELPFPLLADVGHAICDAYGTWGVHEWKGKKSEGITRTTFLIDGKGRIARVFEKVDPGVHADEILTAIDALPS